MERVLDRARLGADYVVLDVGTRTGPLALGALDRIGADGLVIALNRSVDLLDELRDTCPDPRLSFLVGDAEVVPLPDASVDVVLGRAVLGSVRGEGGVAVELRRVLRPRGRVSLFEPVEAESANTWLAEAGFTEVDVERVPGVFLSGEKT